MNHDQANSPLTFGELIASIYRSCDRRRAAGIIRLAVNARLLAIPCLRQRRPVLRKPATQPTVH
ncbi:MAG TPA: hypothetical protein PK322_04240 [Opitutaceae bacterium]|jgi:hypothetical protein|nr:hypothetical protein [Opitutaceae bacterium]